MSDPKRIITAECCVRAIEMALHVRTPLALQDAVDIVYRKYAHKVSKSEVIAQLSAKYPIFQLIA